MKLENSPHYSILGTFPHGWAGVVCLVILGFVIAGIIIHARYFYDA